MKKLNYQNSNSQLTLAEGLAEYYLNNPELLELNKYSSDEQKVLQAHDTCHIVFGCDTTPSSELIVETWSIFGTTIPFREYLKYIQHPEVKATIKEIGWYRFTKETILTLPKIAQVVISCSMLNKKWPVFEYYEYLNMPLVEIREEFGIRLI